MSYTFQQLQANDSGLYRSIRLEALQNYPEYFGSNYTQQAQLEKLYFEKIIEQNMPNGIMIGAFFANQLIGICGVTFDTQLLPNAGEIIQMYVAPMHQGHKIGRDLMNHLYQIVKDQKQIKTLVLGVQKNNIPAIKTYLHCGFEIDFTIQQQEDIQYMSLPV